MREWRLQQWVCDSENERHCLCSRGIIGMERGDSLGCLIQSGVRRVVKEDFQRKASSLLRLKERKDPEA